MIPWTVQHCEGRCCGLGVNLLYLKDERLVEDRVEILLLHFGALVLLLVWQDKHLDIGVRGPTGIHGDEVRSLEDANSEL